MRKEAMRRLKMKEEKMAERQQKIHDRISGEKEEDIGSRDEEGSCEYEGESVHVDEVSIEYLPSFNRGVCSHSKRWKQQSTF